MLSGSMAEGACIQRKWFPLMPTIYAKFFYHFVLHFMRSVQIRSFSSTYFPAFQLITEIYWVNFPIHSKYGKIQTRRAPYSDTPYCPSSDWQNLDDIWMLF